MNEDIVHVALASDKNYVRGLLATLASMVIFAKNKELLQFHVLADGLSDEEKDKVAAIAKRCGAVRNIDFAEPDTSRIVAGFKAYKDSHATFLRLFLGEMLPELNWVIYADVDTLWFRDVSSLWAERDERYPIVWAQDLPSISHGVHQYSGKWNPEFDESRYCCAGVALMNLAWFRREKIAEQSFEFAEKFGTPFFVDQDILNTFFMRNCKILDQRWNGMMPDPEAVDATVLHFNGLGAALRSENLSFSHARDRWLPLYALWFRFYYDVIKENRAYQTATRMQRLVWWMLGLFNPTSSFVKSIIRIVFNQQWQDHVSRQIFFAWLMRKAKWWRKW